MKINYVKNLNDGSLRIEPISFWKALLLSFLFNIILSAVSIPSDTFFAWYNKLFFSNSIVLNSISIITNFIYQYGAMLIIVIIINRSFKLDDDVLYKNPTDKKKYFAAAGMIIGYILLTYGAIDMILYSLPTLNDGLYEYLEEYLVNTSFIFIFLETCIMAPIFEEILYRGILLNGLLKKYNYKKAIIFSALIFGIAHMNLPQGINAFFLGTIIGLAYYYTKSIYVCMLMHFVNNFLVNFVIYPESNLWTIILFVLIPIIGAIVLIKSLKIIKAEEGVQNGQESC